MNVRQINSDPHFQSVGQAGLSVVAKAAKARTAYAYWNEGLILGKGRELTREQQKLLGVHDSDPRPGFYRKSNKGRKDSAVAIWNDETGVITLVDGEPADPMQVWTFVSRWPISKEQYDAVVENGEAWPDDGPAIGDNSGNMPDDPNEAAKVEFDGEREMAEAFLRSPVKTQTDADRAAVWSRRLNDLHGKVDKLFRAEKDPIVVAGREVDEKFRWRDEIKALATALKRHQDEFLREQERLERDRQRKAAEEAERVRRAAEDAARKAQESDQQDERQRAAARAEADRLAAEAAAKAREAEAQKVYAGRTGAKTSLRTFVDAEITDYPKLVEALRDRQEMKDLVQSLANRAAKAGVELPGMKIRQERRAA